MPVFDFKNDWRDWRYQPVGSGEKNNSSSTSGGDNNNGDQLPVFSGYFWIYCGAALASMFFTFWLCWMFISSTSDNELKDKPFRRHVRTVVHAVSE